MTQREFFTTIAKNTTLDTALVEYAKSAITALDIKNKARNSRANAKKTAENESIIKAIREVLADGKPHFAADVCAEVDQNSPKVAALVSKMTDVTVGKAKREGAKAKTTTYTLTVAE